MRHIDCMELLHASCLSRWSSCAVKSVWINMEWLQSYNEERP